MTLLSIIIPVYNVDKYIKECLDSILTQNNKNIEIILVNDGSTDNSPMICQEYSKAYSNIKYIDNENHGVSYSRNCGIKKATGKYLLFVDADDRLSTTGLNTLEKLVKTNKSLYIYSYKKIYKNISENYVIKPRKISKKEALRDLMEEDKFCGYVWNKVFLAELIKKHDIKFDEKITMNEDMKFCFDYINHCKEIVCSDDIIYEYRCRKSSAVNKKIGQKNASSILCYKYIMDNTQDEYVISKCHNYYLKSYYKYKKYVPNNYFDIKLIKEIKENDYKNLTITDKLKINMYKYIPILRTIILKFKDRNKVYFD